MKKSINYIIILSSVGILLACTKDFIVKDIKNATVSIIAPADNLSTPNNAITFWWDELDGAEKYNLQIVKPNFGSVLQLLVDTNITGNKFNYTFTPGNYQWRVKAINAGGSTVYTTRTLTIDTTSNLSLTSVSIVAPGPKFVTASNNVSFSWNALPATNYYEVKVTSSTNSVVTSPNLTNTNYNMSFAVVAGAEETFTWQVKAYNSFSQTQNNEIRTFRIDHKLPVAPSIAAKFVYNYSVTDTDSLVWTRSSQSSDIYQDVITIGTDSLFTSPFTGSVTVGSPIKINTIFTHTSGNTIPLWWKIISVDSVGNASSNATLSKRMLIH